MIVAMMRERNIGIDILKFLAVLMITNSHLEFMYVKFSWLATGGTLGNVLFFFCSGFTLFLKPISRAADFPNWYKRRINRIYPVVLAVAIIRCTFFDFHRDIDWIIIHGGRWFVTYIMVYYVFIYFAGLYLRRHINLLLVAVSLATCVWFFAMDRPFPFNMYGDDKVYLTWPLYFIFMLLGAQVGMNCSDKHPAGGRQWLYLAAALLSIGAFYGICGLSGRVESLAWTHVFSFVPLLIVVYSFYMWGQGDFAKRLYNNRIGHFIICFVGGLCLEIYLIQNSLFTEKLNFLFPLNIPIFLVIVVVAAYLVRCLARLISQTFNDAPYDWKAIVKLY